MTLPDRAQAKSWEGSDVVDRDGDRLGACVGVFADTDTGVTEWLLVDVQGHRRSFVPALEATDVGGGVRVRFSREQVLAAPQVGDDEELARGEEKELYAHYGVAWTPEDSDSLLPQEASVDEATAAPAVAPATRLRRVTQEQSQSSSSSSSSSGGAAAAVGAPAAAVGGLAAVVWLGLRARDRRARRRRSAGARAQRARQRAAQSSAKASKSAGRQWAALAPAAAKTTKQVSTASGTAAKRTTRSASRAATSASDAAGTGARALASSLAAASAAAAKASHEASESVNAASAKAQKASKKRSAAAAKSAAKARKRAAKRAAASRKSSSGALSGLTTTVERGGRRAAKRGGATAATVAGVPHAVERRSKKVAKRGRKARRSFARNVWELVLASAAAGGYVLGARAGRERYEEITDVANAVASRPEVQAATETVRDPQKRQQALTALRDRTSTLTGRASG